jgi:hypothetical protein
MKFLKENCIKRINYSPNPFGVGVRVIFNSECLVHFERFECLQQFKKILGHFKSQ